jgi:hypothetical protein
MGEIQLIKTKVWLNKEALIGLFFNHITPSKLDLCKSINHSALFLTEQRALMTDFKIVLIGGNKPDLETLMSLSTESLIIQLNHFSVEELLAQTDKKDSRLREADLFLFICDVTKPSDINKSDRVFDACRVQNTQAPLTLIAKPMPLSTERDEPYSKREETVAPPVLKHHIEKSFFVHDFATGDKCTTAYTDYILSEARKKAEMIEALQEAISGEDLVPLEEQITPAKDPLVFIEDHFGKAPKAQKKVENSPQAPLLQKPPKAITPYDATYQKDWESEESLPKKINALLESYCPQTSWTGFFSHMNRQNSKDVELALLKLKDGVYTPTECFNDLATLPKKEGGTLSLRLAFLRQKLIEEGIPEESLFTSEEKPCWHILSTTA